MKLRLIVMNFLQFFIWGAWLISFGSYAGNTLHFDGVQIGSFFATIGIASLFMPALAGILADRWIPAQKIYGVCHLTGSVLLAAAGCQTEYVPLYFCMLGAVMMYMPTLSLSYSIAYHALAQEGLDVVRHFPPIRVWGTVGFIAAMWMVDFTWFKYSAMQLYAAAALTFILGLYAFTLPPCGVNKTPASKSWVDLLGLRAFTLFKQRKMAVFFIFSIFLGAALQINNGFGDLFLSSFSADPAYADAFGVQHSVVLLSVSQIAETLCILAIPFFLKRFGIKKVIILSILAWMLRFGLFGLGNPGGGLPLFLLSMVAYGVAFDFFNIAGSLFVEQSTGAEIRAGAQGLFMLMTTGAGAIAGSYAAGVVVNHYTDSHARFYRTGDWASVWYLFAFYMLIVALLFALLFKDKKNLKGSK
jgi:NHS family xanthosine MFS transporter